MRLPTLSGEQSSRDMITAFGGYNHNAVISDAEFYDMQNITGDYYPMVAPRRKRGTYTNATWGTLPAKKLIARDVLGFVSGQYYVQGQYKIDLGLGTTTDKQLISMGGYVIILPDKKYVNVTNFTDYGNIEATFTSSVVPTYKPCYADGSDIPASKYVVGATAPSNPVDGMFWADNSDSAHVVVKQYSATSAIWVSVATTYVKITSAGIGAPFEVGDGVKLSGLHSKLADFEGKYSIIQAKGDGWIVIIAVIDDETTGTSQITVSRDMPVMDHVIESNNRLWGCRYGLNANGDVVNEIYASKLGDFKNWNVFEGTSMDSYTVSLGSDGVFTGAINYLGYPTFFKETCLHKIYGAYPAQYQMQTTPCRGIQQGSNKSLCIINEILYYKSRGQICAYDGSLPVEMSQALGEVAYHSAVAGHIGNKYYVSMKDSAETPHLFVYDTAYKTWHKEDNEVIKDFCLCRTDDGEKEELYYIDATGDIRTIHGSGTPSTAAISWSLTSGLFGLGMPDEKYISRLVYRMMVPQGASVSISIQYDSNGTWVPIQTITGNSLRSFNLPIRVRRCDHFSIEMSGTGDVRIYSVSKTIEQGSDIS